MPQRSSENAFQVLNTRYDKLIRDSIQGNIYVTKLGMSFIDTRPFQRLREVKQLGLCNLVYPGATHTRFEHSLGVYKLARFTAENFYKNWPELEIERADIDAVSLAGLLHDVGHGPFSHVFDNEFLPRVEPGIKWSHEEMSAKMAQYIVDENHIDIEGDLLKRVQDMILCSREPSRLQGYGEKAFLFDIVANGRNSIDVDKFDYIARDCHACGISCSLPFERFMGRMKVIDNEICFRSADANEIWNLFAVRHDLFNKIYLHRKVKAMELMLVDALLLANDHLGISASVHDLEVYSKLEDNILRDIENSDAEELKEARELVIRMRKRGKHLYQFCNECIVPEGKLREFQEVTAKDIVNYSKGDVKLREEDVVVSNSKIEFACGRKHPIDRVHFYKEPDDMMKFPIRPEQLSNSYKKEYEPDRIVRVYAKKPEHVEAVSEAFEEFQVEKYGGKAQRHGTPNGKKRKFR